MLHIKIVSTILNRKLITTGLTVVAMISRNIGTIFFQMIAGPVIDNLGLHMLYLILLIFTVIAMAIAIPFQIAAAERKTVFLRKAQKEEADFLFRFFFFASWIH